MRDLLFGVNVVIFVTTRRLGSTRDDRSEKTASRSIITDIDSEYSDIDLF